MHLLALLIHLVVFSTVILIIVLCMYMLLYIIACYLYSIICFDHAAHVTSVIVCSTITTV